MLKTKAKRKEWTEEENEELRKGYNRNTVKFFCEKFGRTPASVRLHAQRLGLNASRAWTQEEDDYLDMYFGKTSNKALAKKLNRSEKAVRYRAAALGFGKKTKFTDLITMRSFYAALFNKEPGGYKTYTLPKWQQQGLKVYKLALYDTPNHHKVPMIRVDEFWEWAEKHQDLVTFIQMDKFALGAEPDWVKKKRKQEWAEFRKQRWKVKEECYAKAINSSH